MNNSVNLQSPNLGMALKRGNMKQIAEYLNKQEPAVIESLNTKVEEAAKRLKDTKYADVTIHADEQGENLIYNVDYWYPKFNSEGEVSSEFGSYALQDFDEAVSQALAKENAMEAAHSYENALSANLLSLPEA